MKPFKFKLSSVLIIIFSLMGYVGYLIGCTQKDQILLTDPTTINTTDLVSVKTTTAPVIDGAIDAVWDNATKLSATPEVPDPGNGLFAGYIGEKYPTTLRSLYDDQNVYFLAEYADTDKSIFISTWYFDPATKLWAQEPSSRSYNTNGALARRAFGEDKFAMLWNIDNSTAKFTAQTCYASCHVFTPYLDYSLTPAVYKSNANSGNHYTNGANEKIDMWWAHLSKDIVFGQMDDDFQDWAGGPSVTNLTGGNGNGRHVDGLTVSGNSTTWPYAPTYTTATDGSSTNRVTIVITGSNPAKSVNVPKYVIPTATNYYYIKQTDIDAGTAKLVTAVDANGVLTYAGGIIDPNTDTGYQRSGDAVTGDDGVKCIPSYIAAPLTNSRADITCQAVYTGSGWIVEYARALKTTDMLKQDIDFSTLEDQPFGFAIWNNSNNQHAIKPNLVLKFQK